MSVFARRIEVATNIAILCAFVLVAGLAADRLLGRSPDEASEPKVGERILLPGMDWSRSERTLVLALSDGCHFCSESADFYRKLVPSARQRGLRVLAVLPQPVSSSEIYLKQLEVSVPEIVQNSLDALQVSGTPTLLLVDRRGRIERAWVGKLDSAQEQQVLASVR